MFADSIRTEFFKLNRIGYFKKTLIRVFAVAFVITVLSLVIHDFHEQGAYLKFFNILNGFMRFVLVPYILVTTAAQIGKEYDWGTIHHLTLKGQKAIHFLSGKWIVTAGYFTAAYIALAATLVIIYLIFSQGNYVAVPFVSLGVTLFYIWMAISLGIFFGTVAQAATRAIIYTLLYFAVVEFILFFLMGWVGNRFEIDVLQVLSDYTPLAVLQKMAGSLKKLSKGFTIGASLSLIETFVIFTATWFIMRNRELIRPRS